VSTATLERPVPHGEEIVATLRADQNADGTWNLRDVPLYGENVWISPRSKRVYNVGVAWLVRAIQKARAAHQERGYIAPTHVGHHSDERPEEELPAAGFILPKRVQRVTMEGVPTWIMRGDILSIPPEKYADLRAKKLRYLSVEADLSGGEILSCALLSSNPPRFKFGPLAPAVEIPSRDATDGVVHFRAGGRVVVGRYALMADDIKDAKKDEEKGEDVAPPAEQKAADTPPSPAEAQDNALDQKVLDLLTKIAAALGIGAPAAAPPPGGTAASPVEAPGQMVGYSERLAKAEAERDALRKQLEDAKVDTSLRGKAHAAAQELAKCGIQAVEDDLYQRAKNDGEKAMNAYVEAAKKHGHSDPDEVPEGLDTSSSRPEVARFANRGPEVLAKAIELDRLFDTIPAGVRNPSRERFIENGLYAARLIRD
jgi:hypothetical protein